MAGVPITTVQFGGDQPALDRKQVQDPYVVEGENYLVDAAGPYSAFGNAIISYARIEGTDDLYSFSVENEFFLFHDEAVLRYDEITKYYYPEYIYETADATQKWPWTHALVGGKYYFARKGYGLIQYTPNTGEWKEVTGSGLADSQDIYACLEVAGRLIVLFEDGYQWSDIDDGEQFTTNTSTGTGAQALSIVGGGTPYGLYRTAVGFCVFTSEGVVNVEKIDALALTFRHLVLTRDTKPLDQYNVIQFGRDTVLMLTKNGLFTTSGRTPEAFEPLMSEYFVRELFPRMNLATVGLIRLTYSEDHQWLFVSVSENEIPFEYPLAHVLYRTVQKWGRFNRNHVALGDFDVTKSALSEKNFGFICFCSFPRVFIEYPVSEQLLVDDLAGIVYFTNGTVDYPSRWQNGVINFASFIHMSGIDRGDYPVNPGLYTQADQSPRPPDVQSIDSMVLIGPYRLRAQDQSQYINIMETVAVGMLEEPPFVEDEDWNLMTGDEDWNSLTGDEDWGYDIFSSVNYNIKGVGTLDGYAVWDDQEEVLTEETNEGRIKFFSCDVHGYYLFVEVTAQEVNQSFHLKFLEPQVNLGGVL